jgi:hypothetical protein
VRLEHKATNKSESAVYSDWGGVATTKGILSVGPRRRSSTTSTTFLVLLGIQGSDTLASNAHSPCAIRAAPRLTARSPHRYIFLWNRACLSAFLLRLCRSIISTQLAEHKHGNTTRLSRRGHYLPTDRFNTRWSRRRACSRPTPGTMMRAHPFSRG